MWGRDLISFFETYGYMIIPALFVEKQFEPWTTWVWTALVHFMHIFFNRYITIMLHTKTQGWMSPGMWTWVRRATCKVICKIFNCMVGVQGQLHCAFLFKCLTVLVFKIFFLQLTFIPFIYMSVMESDCFMKFFSISLSVLTYRYTQRYICNWLWCKM